MQAVVPMHWHLCQHQLQSSTAEQARQAKLAWPRPVAPTLVPPPLGHRTQAMGCPQGALEPMQAAAATATLPPFPSRYTPTSPLHTRRLLSPWLLCSKQLHGRRGQACAKEGREGGLLLTWQGRYPPACMTCGLRAWAEQVAAGPAMVALLLNPPAVRALWPPHLPRLCPWPCKRAWANSAVAQQLPCSSVLADACCRRESIPRNTASALRLREDSSRSMLLDIRREVFCPHGQGVAPGGADSAY